MYLGPHHFQAQARFYEETIGFSVAAAAAWGYGLMSCELDSEAVRTGTLRLLKARGVFPDGTPFDMPDQDPLPPARNLNTTRARTENGAGVANDAAAPLEAGTVTREIMYEPSGSGMDVCLALPVRRSGGNFGQPGNGLVRFNPVPVRMADEALGRGEAEITIGRKNVNLLRTREAVEREGAYGPRWTWLPVARVTRDASGAFAFDPDFIPAAMRVRASSRLVEIIDGLLSVLGERASAVSADHARRSGTWGFSARDVMQFWFLNAVHTSIPALTHLLAQDAHPSQVFLELSRLAGALCTFATASSPAMLPTYDPLRPGEAIGVLDAHIRRHLDVAFPVTSIRIPLTPLADGFWEGALHDARLTGKGSWILGVRSSARADEVIANVPEVVKICSARWIGKLVDRQLPGMKLQHLKIPPPESVPSREFQYFSVERAGHCWQDVSGTQRVGVYVPATLKDVQLDLVALPE
jgi:type VI secretion system protein ImpJ